MKQITIGLSRLEQLSAATAIAALCAVALPSCSKEHLSTTSPNDAESLVIPSGKMCITLQDQSEGDNYDETSKANFLPMTDEKGKKFFDFRFSDGDMLKAGPDIPGYDGYLFRRQGNRFVNVDEISVVGGTKWKATFCGNNPDKTVYSANGLCCQDGSLQSCANLYAQYGKTAEIVKIGSKEIAIHLDAKAAVIQLVVKAAKGVDLLAKTPVSSTLVGVKDHLSELSYIDFDSFIGKTGNDATALFKTSSPGTYYLVVPSGEHLVFFNGKQLLKMTGESGFEAGRYYTLTVEDHSWQGEDNGYAWVQLWDGGPKWAVSNAGASQSFHKGDDPCKHSDAEAKAKALGAGWRLPSEEESDALQNEALTHWEWVSSYLGVKQSGYIVYRCKDTNGGKNPYKMSDPHIFLPYNITSATTLRCNFWTGAAEGNKAYVIGYKEGVHSNEWISCTLTRSSVRAVRD